MILRRYRLHNSSFIKTPAAAWETDISWGRATIKRSFRRTAAIPSCRRAGGQSGHRPRPFQEGLGFRASRTRKVRWRRGFVPLSLQAPPFAPPTLADFHSGDVRPWAPPGRWPRDEPRQCRRTGRRAGRASEGSPGGSLRAAARSLSGWRSGCGSREGTGTDAVQPPLDTLDTSARRRLAQRRPGAWCPPARSGQTPPPTFASPKRERRGQRLPSPSAGLARRVEGRLFSRHGTLSGGGGERVPWSPASSRGAQKTIHLQTPRGVRRLFLDDALAAPLRKNSWAGGPGLLHTDAGPRAHSAGTAPLPCPPDGWETGKREGPTPSPAASARDADLCH